jgi:aspartate-semialdehyde dehydrogenase
MLYGARKMESLNLETKIPVAVLGATGAVGQRLVGLLEKHPWFALAEVAASAKSAGRLYGEAARWLLPGPPPPAARRLRVLAVGDSLESPLVFSCLEADAARDAEPLYANRGHRVISNASAFRLSREVPLLVPEVNPHALELLGRQEWAVRTGGIVTNPNCCVAGLVMALAPLRESFGIESVVVTTLQALSGAGYPGVASLDALANVIPHIAGEEEKIEREPRKIFGDSFPVSVAVNRVPVRDGHTESVFVRLERRAPLAEIRAAMAEFRGEPQRLGLPSAPPRPLIVLDEPDRPQPARDAERENGMAVFVGGLRRDPVYDARFTVLVHNTMRGAAGAALLNAELLAARGYVGTNGPAAEAAWSS